VSDERLQHLLGDGRVKTRGWLVEHEEPRAATEGKQERELGSCAAGELPDLPVQWELERPQVLLFEVDPPARVEPP
jgi:hypothetical protein